MWAFVVDLLSGTLHFLGLIAGTLLAFACGHQGQHLVYNPSRIPLRHRYWFRGLVLFLSVWMVFSFGLFVLADEIHHRTLGEPSFLFCIATGLLLGLLNPLFGSLKRLESVKNGSVALKSFVGYLTLFHQLLSRITFGYLTDLTARAERRISSAIYWDDRPAQGVNEGRIDEIYSGAVRLIQSKRAVGRFKQRAGTLTRVNHPRVKIELLLRHYGFRSLLEEYLELGGFKDGLPFRSARWTPWVFGITLAAAFVTLLQALLKFSKWLINQI